MGGRAKKKEVNQKTKRRAALRNNTHAKKRVKGERWEKDKPVHKSSPGWGGRVPPRVKKRVDGN